MDLQAMYALLCEVQQASVAEESQLKQLKSEVQYLKDKNSTLRASLDVARAALQESDGNLKHVRQECSIATTKHAAALDGCNFLREALVAATKDEEQLMNEARDGWRQVSAAVTLRLCPQAPSRSCLTNDEEHPTASFTALTEGNDGPLLCATSTGAEVTLQLPLGDDVILHTNNNAHNNVSNPKFAIRRGPTTAKKTMFQFR
jgi:hypothetical protein